MQHCWTSSLSLLDNDDKGLETSCRTNRWDWKVRDWLFITRLLPEPFKEAIQASTTISQQLVEGAQQSVEVQATSIPLPPYTRGFKSMFAKDDFDILLEHHQWDHTIELLPGSKPKSTKVYPLSLVEQKELDTFLEENLYTRWICPSKLPMAIPVFFIKKKDGSLQLVQDYWPLNSMTVKNIYPLSLISELIA